MAVPTRVLVADDHPVYLDGLAAAIRRTGDLDLIATCRDGAEALETIRREVPDVAVLDLRMPRLGARDVLAELGRAGPRCAVLILSVHVDGDDIHECLGLGAAGYIAKDSDRSAICDAIRGIAAGRAVLSDEALTNMAAALRQRRAAERELLSAPRARDPRPAGARRLSARHRGEALPQHRDGQDPPAQPVPEARGVGPGRRGRGGHAPRSDPLTTRRSARPGPRSGARGR